MAAQKRRRSRGSIRVRGDVFQVRVYAGLDPLTKTPFYLTGTATTAEEAEKLRTRFLAQIDEKRQPRTNATVGQLLDQWLDVAELEMSTRDGYERKIAKHIRPALGELSISRLDAETLERFYGQLRRCRERCGGRLNGKKVQDAIHVCRPLSEASVRQIHFILRAALRRAVRWRWIAVNPAEEAEPPSSRKPEPDPPSAEEAAALLNASWERDPDWATLLWLAMTVGARRGELCALRWSDVDLDRGVLTIRRNYVQAGAQRVEKDTKTHQQRRVALGGDTVEILRDHRQRCQQHAAAVGGVLPVGAYVFSAVAGGSAPVLPDSITQRYARLATRLGLGSTRLHSLRHYSATELIAAGVDLRTVAGRLGHGSGGATTLRVYAAWVEEADRRAAEAVGRRLPRRAASSVDSSVE